MLCPGLEAKMGSVETCGWTIGRGARRGVLARSRGFYLAIPSLKNKHRPGEDPKAPQAGFPLRGWGPDTCPLPCSSTPVPVATSLYDYTPVTGLSP